MSVSNTAVARVPSRSYDVAIVLAALGAIVGSQLASGDAIDGWHWLHWACKPLATFLILWSTWHVRHPVSVAYRHWIGLGMVFSLAGDVFLMLPLDGFVAGLVAFLIGHLCFLRALLSDSRFAKPWWPLLATLGFGAINLWLLWPILPAALHAPVVVYVVVLTSMGGQAVARAWAQRQGVLAGAARWAALGALSFMLSDTLLAWNRFRVAIPWSPLWILATYYVALWCLARSVRRGA